MALSYAVPVRTRPPLGSRPTTVKTVARTGQKSMLSAAPGHSSVRGFCNRPCGLCEADMKDRIRHNARRR